MLGKPGEPRMNQKLERPTLQGQRFRTRKRDEKEKFNPSGFRDSVLQSFNELSDGKLTDNLIKCLTTGQFDFRLYGEVLFDIIIAGGILAPGGSIVIDSDATKSSKTDFCLFKAVDQDDLVAIKDFANIFVRLIQRFGYLEKTLIEEFKKIIVFLKGFDQPDRVKLAKLTAVLLSQGFLPASVLLSAIQDHLVKDGLALDFLVQVLKTWVDEKDSTTVWNQLRKGSVYSKLLEFLPANKRSSENIVQTFQNNGLSQLVVFQKAQETEAKKYELQKQIAAMITKNTPMKEVIEFVKDVKRKNGLDEAESAVLVWKTLMSLVEWNKKEELLADQALKHLRTYSPLVAAFTTTAKAELSLLIKIQEYCYDNMNFLKTFQKIIALFYKADVLSEDAILKWYREAHLPKGKSIFLPEMKGFVEWLESAEEESGAEEE